MRGKVNLMGHGVHPMLIVFPLALLTLTPITDIVRLVTRNSFWSHVSFFLAFAGVVAGVVAAIPGFLDWLTIPRGTRARRVGVTHLTVNLIGLALFTISIVLRMRVGAERFAPVAFLLAAAGAATLVVGGWFGGELVERLSVGVWSDAHLEAPSSLDAVTLMRRPGDGARPHPGPPTEPRPA